eukprot:COSAG01_NODE_6551_length_3614_cov_2.669513_2_plen_370_part_00
MRTYSSSSLCVSLLPARFPRRWRPPHPEAPPDASSVMIQCGRLRALRAHLRPSSQCLSQTTAGALPTPSAAEKGIAATSDSALALAQFIKFGFCILDGAIAPEALPALRASAEATAERHNGWHYELFPDHDTEDHRSGRLQEYLWHVGGVLRHDLSFAPHVASPPVMALMEQAFDTPQSELLTTFTTLQVNRPGMDVGGRGAGGWHSDGYLEQEASYPGEQQLRRPGHINCLFFLSDFSVVNGGTWMIPASHRLPESATPQNSWIDADLDRAQPERGAVHVTGPAGACCVMDCRVYHCTPPNASDANRVMINVRYAPKSIFPLHTFKHPGQPPWPPLPRPVFERLPPSVRPLYEHAVLTPEEQRRQPEK